jgi:pimeloyl-ACP methyl ester carboxylesterase
VIALKSGDTPLNLQEKSFLAGSIQLHYAEVPNAAPPLVLLHGLARNWRDFLPLIPELAKNHHVYALDLRGHGLSSRYPQGYTVASYASDVMGFLEHTLTVPAVLFGHSLGGMVGMYIASQAPHRVRALILGDTMLARDGFTRSMYFSFFQTLHSLLLTRTSIAGLARRLGQAEIRVPGIDHPVPIGELAGNDDASLLKWAECLDQVDPDTVAMTLNGTAYADFEPEDWLGRIHCPTLLLQANPELGGLMLNAEISSALRLLRNPAHEYFPLLGHALHLQNPASVLNAVTSYLSSL